MAISLSDLYCKRAVGKLRMKFNDTRDGRFSAAAKRFPAAAAALLRTKITLNKMTKEDVDDLIPSFLPINLTDFPQAIV